MCTADASKKEFSCGFFIKRFLARISALVQELRQKVSPEFVHQTVEQDWLPEGRKRSSTECFFGVSSPDGFLRAVSETCFSGTSSVSFDL